VALDALGPYAIDLLALAGEATDQGLAKELALGFPTTPTLLDALGRAGFPALFPRLLAALDGDDFEDDAHSALVTALGSRVTRPSLPAWEQILTELPRAEELPRLRGGKPHTPASVLEEMRRPELSELDLRARAAEVFVKTGRRTHLEWGTFGVSLSGALSDLARLVP
jgi:hypothetical protein